MLERPVRKYPCFDGRQFTFLNVTAPFISWNDVSKGLLWAYNLNYSEWLEQMSAGEACRWLDRYISDFPSNTVGQDPYPTALRTLNWCKFFSIHPECGTGERLDSLYSQYRLLSRRVEYHISGNHLLEDALALTVGAIMFEDGTIWRSAFRLLKKCLREQILPDGAHYEQSPMYHCVLLDRLLDVYNLSVSNRRFREQDDMNRVLRSTAVRMLGHLENMTLSDGNIPLLNDSAYGIAPTPGDIFDYARRLSLEWVPIALGECGYRHFRLGRMEAVMDVANITASHQCGHTHADTFTYELYVDGRPFIVDTGISTYEKNLRRQYERSTPAHNTVEAGGKDSSQVWGGFRVGKRASVKILREDERYIEAEHYGYGKRVARSFSIGNNIFSVKDYTDACDMMNSYIHFSPGVDAVCSESGIRTSVADILVEGADSIEIVDNVISRTYNRFYDIKVARISFTKDVLYRIVISNH